MRRYVIEHLNDPVSWTGDAGRCASAGIPADVTFTTKPQPAWRMIERVVSATVSFARRLETQRLAHAQAVACDHRVPAGAGTSSAPISSPPACRAPWQRLSAGAGAKGQHWYDRPRVTISDPGPVGIAALLQYARLNVHTSAADAAYLATLAVRNGMHRVIPLPIRESVAGFLRPGRACHRRRAEGMTNRESAGASGTCDGEPGAERGCDLTRVVLDEGTRSRPEK